MGLPLYTVADNLSAYCVMYARRILANVLAQPFMDRQYDLELPHDFDMFLMLFKNSISLLSLSFFKKIIVTHNFHCFPITSLKCLIAIQTGIIRNK